MMGRDGTGRDGTGRDGTGLAGRVALVTGAGRGIGRAIAVALAAEGAKVVAAARTTDELHSVAESITRAGGKAVAFQVDLSDRGQTRQLMEQAAEPFGPATQPA